MGRAPRSELGVLTQGLAPGSKDLDIVRTDLLELRNVVISNAAIGWSELSVWTDCCSLSSSENLRCLIVMRALGHARPYRNQSEGGLG